MQLKKLSAFIITIIFLLPSAIVQARMYQWTDPETGTTQLSGKPPAWYRGNHAGPRVFVFEKGRLIDDTDVVVDDDTRLRMRRQAFVIAEEDMRRAQEKLERSETLQQQYVQDENVDTPQEVEAMQQSPEAMALNEELEKLNDSKTSAVTGEDVEELKKIIEDWEKARKEKAKQVVQ